LAFAAAFSDNAAMPARVGFLSDPRFADHQTGPSHPERPDRIRAIARAVRSAGMISSPDPFPDFRLDLPLSDAGVKLVELPPPQPADLKWIETVHRAEYIESLRRGCELGAILDQGDTPVHPGSFEVALLAVGGLLQCCDAVMSGEVQRAFAAIRPPGHHAEPDRPMGFCLFANVAIAAKYLQQRHGVKRLAIVDFDVHHGNGTQACFEEDPSVLFISLHQHPRTCYPGSGYEYERGEGAGVGYTINLTMDPGTEDDEYEKAFDATVIPALDRFAPEMLLISAGFDGHRDDPLAQIFLSDAAYEMMTRKLVAAAERHCGGKIVSALEGGYNLAPLGRSVVRHLIALAE
jgi:acetoin utilization deacetylase AcuC-like enzyme